MEMDKRFIPQMTASNRTIPNYEFGEPLPNNFPYSTHCTLNNIAFVQPKTGDLTRNGTHIRDTYRYNNPNVDEVCWQKKALAPSSVKHLYSEKLFDYQHVYGNVPKGTLYDHDFSRTYPTGLGREKVIGGGHYKTWPLTNWHVLEVQDYTDGYYPILEPQYWVGSEIQTQPNHVHSNWRKVL